VYKFGKLLTQIVIHIIELIFIRTFLHAYFHSFIHYFKKIVHTRFIYKIRHKQSLIYFKVKNNCYCNSMPTFIIYLKQKQTKCNKNHRNVLTLLGTWYSVVGDVSSAIFRRLGLRITPFYKPSTAMVITVLSPTMCLEYPWHAPPQLEPPHLPSYVVLPRMVDCHFPQWNYIPTSGVGSLFFNEFGYPVVVSCPSQLIFAVLHSYLHHKHFIAS